MTTYTYTRKGHKFRHYASYGSRFGPGKVHLQMWHKMGKDWVTLCRSKMDSDHQRVYGFSGIHGAEVDKTDPVTCKKCLVIKEELEI